MTDSLTTISDVIERLDGNRFAMVTSIDEPSDTFFADDAQPNSSPDLGQSGVIDA